MSRRFSRGPVGRGMNPRVYGSGLCGTRQPSCSFHRRIDRALFPGFRVVDRNPEPAANARNNKMLVWRPSGTDRVSGSLAGCGRPARTAMPHTTIKGRAAPPPRLQDRPKQLTRPAFARTRASVTISPGPHPLSPAGTTAGRCRTNQNEPCRTPPTGPSPANRLHRFAQRPLACTRPRRGM